MNCWANVALLGLLSLSCAEAGAQQESNTAAQAKEASFVYAPELDRPHREVMRRSEMLSIPGSPMRNQESWLLDWQVVTRQESNLFRRTLQLVGLKINVNGAELLRGDEVKGSSVKLEILTDKDSNVVDVRGTQEFSDALVALGSPEAQPVLRRIFSAGRLKALAVERSLELHSDFVGRPSQVGSTWMANDPSMGGTRQMRVLAQAPCGKAKCVQVKREYDVDRQALYADITQRVGAYVQSQGGDPSKVAVTGMELKLEDSLVIDPATMDYHA
ncbi:MAG TPA: hypothetical protein VIW29_12890, partial [Polyangiaceae bacterium]